jgi:hypothetical protein
MTRCLIRKDFFHNDSYKIIINNPDDKQAFQEDPDAKRTLVEFCLPFAELKHIVEGMVDDDGFSVIDLEWPVSDSYLRIGFTDEPRGGNNKFKCDSLLQLETYEA